MMLTSGLAVAEPLWLRLLSSLSSLLFGQWLEATTYLQLIGILLGQLTFGFAGDWIGRKVDSTPLERSALEQSKISTAELVASPPPDNFVLQSAMLIDMTIVLLGVIMLTVSNGTTEQVTPLAP